MRNTPLPISIKHLWQRLWASDLLRDLSSFRLNTRTLSSSGGNPKQTNKKILVSDSLELKKLVEKKKFSSLRSADSQGRIPYVHCSMLHAVCNATLPPTHATRCGAVGCCYYSNFQLHIALTPHTSHLTPLRVKTGSPDAPRKTNSLSFFPFCISILGQIVNRCDADTPTKCHHTPVHCHRNSHNHAGAITIV